MADASWNELWELVEPLLYSPHSHLQASIQGWMRAPEPVEDAAFFLIDAYRSMHRKKNAPPLEPLKRPWQQPRPKANAPRRSAEDRKRSRAKLMEHLGMN